MSASENLSDRQFEITKPNHSVRIGDRHYPASRTHGGDIDAVHGAHIPMENGALVHVRTLNMGPKDSGLFHVSEPEPEAHKWGYGTYTTKSATVVKEVHDKRLRGY